jgi:hypothetical protein
MNDKYNLKFRWTTSRGRDTYGYNICSLLVNGEKVASCNGGGYDMQGTSLGDWVARKFKDQLLKFDQEFTGLKFYNPNWKPSQETLDQEKKDGFQGLTRYQDFHSASSKLPTEQHTVPDIDGAYGFQSVTKIIVELGYTLELIDYKDGIYIMRSKDA